jgi:filamentous hemagglutinin
VVALSGTGGVTLSAGAIMAGANVQGFPGGASTASGLSPSIAIGGGAFAQTGGTISATGSGASVVLTPASFSQSAGVLASDGDLRIGSGSGAAGTLGGAATSLASLFQSGGVIAAVSNLTLWTTGALTQSAGVIAAGGTLAASAAGDIAQGTLATTSATTTIATMAAPTVHLVSTGGNARQGGDGMVAGSQTATIDPLAYPVRIQAPAGINSFSVFGTTGAVTASGGYVVFSPSSNVTASGALAALPATPSASAAAATAVLPDVVLLGDSIAPITSGATARDLALYSRQNTTGKVTAALLTGRAGVLTQDASDLSPYPLPDLVRAAETTLAPGGSVYWSTASGVIGNVTLTGGAVTTLGTITSPGTTGFGYGATGSFSLDNIAPGGTLTVMAGGTAGSNVYPGIAAWGGTLSITEGGQIAVHGPIASSTTLTLGAGADLVITASAALGATSAISLTTAGAYLQDSGLVDAPSVSIASTQASGTGVLVSGGTISATGGSGVLSVTSVAGISQTGGVIASDNAITIGTGSGAGTVSGVASATSSFTQNGGTIAAVGNLTLYTTGALTQTSGLIAAGGTLAATASGDIIQGTPALTAATTTVASMTGSTVALFSTGGAARQGGDGIVAANQSGSVDPSTYLLRIQSPTGVNSFSIFGAAASVTAGSIAFNPAADLSASAVYRPLTTYSPASVGSIGLTAAALPDVVLLGDSIAFQSTGVAVRDLALYSRHATQGVVNATLLTGRAGVLTTDTLATPDFVVPALVKAVENQGFWSTAANITDGNFFLPNSLTNGGTVTVSAIQNLGTTVSGVNYGIGATGSFNLDNKAPGATPTSPGTLTVAGGLMAWTGGVRINEVGTSDVMLVAGDINVASPGSRGVQTSGTTMVAGLLSLSGNSITLGKSGSGAGGSVTLQATMLEITGKSDVKVLDGVTIDTGDNGPDIFSRPLAGLAPKDPQKISIPPVHVPGALFNVGAGGFTQTGTFTMAAYTPTAYKLSGPSYTQANHPVLEIVLTNQTGAIAFDPATTLGLMAPKVSVIVDIGTGSATGNINADTLALFYTQQTGLPSIFTGTLRTALGIPVTGQAAASQAFIAQNILYVPSNHFQMNGCALSSVNCVLTSLFPQVIVANPFKDIAFGRFADPLDDPDLLLPNVSDRDY